jgi:hypothetical protein
MTKRIAKFSPNPDSPLPKITKERNQKSTNQIFASNNPFWNNASNPWRNTSTADAFQTPFSFSTPRNTDNPSAERSERNRSRFDDAVDGILHNSMHSLPEGDSTFISPLLNYVYVDIFRKDDAPFDSLLPRDSLKLLWIDLGLDIDNVKILYRERRPKKSLRVFFILIKGVSIIDVTHCLECLIEINTGSGVFVFGVRFPQFKEVVCELGHKVNVTFKNVPAEITCKELRNWLTLFGQPSGSFRYNSPLHPYSLLRHSLSASPPSRHSLSALSPFLLLATLSLTECFPDRSLSVTFLPYRSLSVFYLSNRSLSVFLPDHSLSVLFIFLLIAR